MRATGSESSMSKSMQCKAKILSSPIDDIPFSEPETTEMLRGARDLQAMKDEQS